MPSITSHICAKEGLKEEHLAKKERTVASSFCICVVQRPSGSPSAPEKENHTPRYLYLAASVGGTVVIVCSRKIPDSGCWPGVAHHVALDHFIPQVRAWS